jgi:6-phospho-beta-glucosidase
VENLLRAGESRAQQILPFNLELFANLRQIRDEEASPLSVESTYARYLDQRHGTYMTLETGEPSHLQSQGENHLEGGAAGDRISESAEGYSAVALNVIEALVGNSAALILNVPNRGAVPGMADDDVVEVTCHVGSGVVRPIAMGSTIPDHALGLMKTVKAYERLTIQAAVEGSYALAAKALALHPLVPSYNIARAIVDDYRTGHGDYFPELS